MHTVSITMSAPDIDVPELQQVANELAQRVLTRGWDHLQGIEVVEDAELEQHVRSVVARHFAYRGQGYTTPPHGPSGVTVPIQIENTMVCYIVLPKSGVLPPPRTATVVSLLLEELLHVETYAKYWAINGYLSPDVPVYLHDLAFIASILQNEYVVNRRKSEILGNEAIAEIDGVRQAVCLRIHEPLENQFNLSGELLRDLFRSIGAGLIVWPDSWFAMTNWLHRQVFGLLAYDAGYRALRAPSNEAVREASRSPFFRVVVSPFWDRLLTRLVHTYDSDLASFDDDNREIVSILRSFLAHLGVHMDETGHVRFDQSMVRWT